MKTPTGRRAFQAGTAFHVSDRSSSDQDSSAGEDRLAPWRMAASAHLLAPSVGRRAVAAVVALGAKGLARLRADEAERLAFSATVHVLAQHLPQRLDGLAEPVRFERVALAVSVFGTVQAWAERTGLSPFTAGVSQTAPEAMERYRAARECDQFSEEFGIGERIAALCWVRAANREAFRAVMRDPRLLAGEDTLAEEMLRIAAAEHIVRLRRTATAAAGPGREEVDAAAVVEQAIKRASRLAIEQQRKRNLQITGTVEG